jgi:predicted metal-dependent enzyme (double-stranded beta helix superfamily)
VPISPTLRAAVDEIVAAARAGPDRLDRIRSVLQRITDRLHRLGALVHEADDDEVLLHASEALTVYHITLTPGLRYPPHEHLLDALIGIYRGGETNFIYDAGADGDALPAPVRHDAVAPALVHLPPEAVHAVANTGSARSGALHVYLGDLLRSRRRMWDQAGARVEPFDDGRYLASAVPIAPGL